MLKKCSKCNTTKTNLEFSRNKTTKDGYAPWCKSCMKTVVTIYRKNNKEKCKQQLQNWRKNNNEKVKAQIKRNYINNRQKRLDYSKLYNRKNKRKRANAHLLRRFNITIEDYETMLMHQNGTCALCDAKPTINKRLEVDHCHKTGQIRGLLCGAHNKALGLFKDQTYTLEKAVRYLNQRTGEQHAAEANSDRQSAGSASPKAVS